MSTRRLTSEQFADGTSVDGDRIDRALEDAVRHVNDVPKRDIDRRFVQTQFVSGHFPVASTQLPFMRTENNAVQTAAGSPDAYENPFRAKGVFHSDYMKQNVWTAAAIVTRPVVVVQMDWLLITDTTFFDNDFVYGTSPPPGKSTGDSVDDFAVTLTVDSPFSADTRTEDSLVLIRKNFKASAENVSLKTPTGVTDMKPSHPFAPVIAGVWVHLRDIVVPIPRDSRMRWSLTLPEWDEDEEPWGNEPWREQTYSTCMTMLEEVQP